MQNHRNKKKPYASILISKFIYLFLAPIKITIFLGKQMFLATHYTANTISGHKKPQNATSSAYAICENFRDGFATGRIINIHNIDSANTRYIKKLVRKK